MARKRRRHKETSGQIDITVLFLLLISFCILIVGFTALKSPILVLGLVGGLIIALIALVNTNLALIIIIFSMLLSPEIPIAQLPERAIVVRIDDILILFIFFAWLAKTALNRELGLLKTTPINRPLFIYILLCIVATALAISLRIGRARFSVAFFYLLKYIEYFMLFFLVSNNLRSIKQAKLFTVFLLLVCFIVGIYGYYQIQTGILRVSAPFEGEKPEPNTLSGYLLVMFGLIAGLFLYSQKARLKFLLGTLFLFLIPIFLFTLSRSGYGGFIVMYLSLIVFTKKKKVFLIGLLLVLILILPFVLPTEVITRVRTTFMGTMRYEVLGKRLTLDEATAGRIETWRYIGDIWKKSPIFGYGITGIAFVDTQYGRILGELGIIGILVFFWLIWRLFRNALAIYRSSEDNYVQGLCLGFLAGFIALLVHSIGANTFIIVRIMEPFWFLAAIVMMLPEISQGEKMNS